MIARDDEENEALTLVSPQSEARKARPLATAAFPLVSVIVPTHDGGRFLRECLDALRAQTYGSFEAIVVDDASTDGTVSLLQDYREFKVVRLPGRKGHGFVAAVNAGLAVAEGEIIALLNDDAVPDRNWISELVSSLERNPWASMAASKIMLHDRPDYIHSTGDYYGLDGVPNSRGVWQRDEGQYEREEEVFGPCAAAAAYRRVVLDEVANAGGTTPAGRVLDPLLWMYAEDVDLNMRARLLGRRTVYVPAARVRHRLSATGGGSLASYYVGRNLVYVAAKDLPFQVITRNFPAILRAQVRFALEALRHIREPAARARLRGICVGALTWPRVLPARRRVQRTAKVKWCDFARTLRQFGP